MVGFLGLCRHFAANKIKETVVKTEENEQDVGIDSAKKEEEGTVSEKKGQSPFEKVEENQQVNDLEEEEEAERKDVVVIKKEAGTQAELESGEEDEKSSATMQPKGIININNEKSEVPTQTRATLAKRRRKAARAKLERALGIRPSYLRTVFDLEKEREKERKEVDADQDFLLAVDDAIEECDRILEASVDVGKTRVIELVADDVLVSQDNDHVDVDTVDDDEKESRTKEPPDGEATTSSSEENIFLQSYFNPPQTLLFPFRDELDSPVIDEGDLQVSDDEADEEEEDVATKYCDASTETSEDYFEGTPSPPLEMREGDVASWQDEKNNKRRDIYCRRRQRKEEDEELLLSLSGKMGELYLSEDEEGEEEHEIVAVRRKREEEEDRRDLSQVVSHSPTNCAAEETVTKDEQEGEEEEGRFYGESRLDRERRKRKKRKEREKRKMPTISNTKRRKRRLTSDGDSEVEDVEESDDAVSSCSSLEDTSRGLKLCLRPKLVPKRPARTASTESSASSNADTEMEKYHHQRFRVATRRHQLKGAPISPAEDSDSGIDLQHHHHQSSSSPVPS